MPKRSKTKISTSALKIALVLDDSLDPADGVQQYVLTVGEWLRSQGHDVHYLVGASSRTDIKNVHSLSYNVKVRFNGNRLSIPLPTSRRQLKALLEAEQFDVLHIQMPYSPFLAGRLIAAAAPRTAVVGTFHVAPHSRFVELANRALGVWVRHSAARFDGIMSVSPVAQAFARACYGLESVVVPNTIDLTPFLAAKPFSAYRSSSTIVFLGRLVERKGCMYLLRAVACLKREGTLPDHVCVVICGRGPLETSLKQYVSENGLTDIVEFAGFIEEADKPRYLASADIAVFPSTGGESFGIVLIEAMAAGRGVVLAGDNPGYAGVMRDRPEALFDPKDEVAFAALLAAYLSEKDRRNAARAWQRRHVMQYDAPIIGERILSEYRNALHRRRT